MKDQIFEILHNRKRMPGELFSDVEGRIELLIDTEVDRRIKERMPSEEEIEEWMQENRWASARQYGRWLRSRLTQPNNSEGGGDKYCVCKGGSKHSINRICQKCKGIIPIKY